MLHKWLWMFLDHADGGGGAPDPPVVEPGVKGGESRDELLKEFALVSKTIQEGTGNQEKLIEALGTVSTAIQKWDAKSQSKMEFPAGAATKRLVKTGGYKALMDTPCEDEQVKELQKLNDDLCIVHAVCAAAPPGTYGGIKSLGMFAEFAEARDDFAKAMDTATAGAASEWVPSMLSAQLQSVMDLELQVAGLHRSFPMPAPTFTLPLKLAHSIGYRGVQTTDADSPAKYPKSVVTSGDVTYTAEKVVGRVVWTGEMDEDSVVPMLPLLREDIPVAVGRAVEYAVIDGQITGVIDTGDDPSGTASDPRNLWDGYRYYANTNSAQVDLSSAWTLEGIRSIRKAMGKTGIYPQNLAWVVSTSAYFQLLSLRDSQNNPVVYTLAGAGAQATNLTGVLGFLDNIQVIPSEFVREDLNVTGIHDGTTETDTIIACVHKPSWMFGTRKELTVEASPEPYFESGDLVIRGIARMDFQALFPYANQVAVAVGYGITS